MNLVNYFMEVVEQLSLFILKVLKLLELDFVLPFSVFADISLLKNTLLSFTQGLFDLLMNDLVFLELFYL